MMTLKIGFYYGIISILFLFQAKDDQEKWAELKEQLIQYERRRIDLVSYFEAVRHAQQVQVDEIPLPSAVNDISRIYPGKYIQILIKKL